MRTTLPWSFGILLLLLGCEPTPKPAEMGLEEILSAHTAALGGSNAIQNVAGLEIDLRIKEPTFTVTAKYLATRDGRMRIDVFHDEQRVFTEAFDGDSGWQWLQNDETASDTSSEGEAALQRGIVGNIFGTHELPSMNYELSLIGQETIDETDYWLIDSVSPKGFSQRLYINSETFLVERTREEGALHPDVDSDIKRFETLQSDYRERAGRLFSFKGTKVDLDTGEVVQTTEIVRLTVNPEIDTAAFNKPLSQVQ